MLITQAEYAKRRNVSRAAITQAVKRGRITLVDGKIDPEKADRELDSKTDHRQTRKPRPKVPKVNSPPVPTGQVTDAGAFEEKNEGDFQEAQRQHEWEKVLKERRARKVREEELLEAAIVDAKWAHVGTRVRDEVAAIPTRVVNRLPDEWRRQVSLIASEEIRRALDAIDHEFLPNRATT